MAGRLRDVVWMMRQALRAAFRQEKGPPAAAVPFAVLHVPRGGTRGQARAELQVALDGGDDGSPSATILLAGED